MKKILIISYYFPPTIGGGIFRVMRFIKYLPQNGWEAVVLTPKDSYVTGEDKDVGNKILSEIEGKTEVIRTSNFEILASGRRNLDKLNTSASTLRKSEVIEIKIKILLFFKKYLSNILKSLLVPDEVIGWIPFAVSQGLKIIKNEGIRVVYTTAPPISTHLIGLFLSKIKNIHWIVDFRDPWTQRVDFNNHNFIRRKIELFLEAAVIKKANVVVTTTPAITDFFKNKYSCHAHKIFTITNGYDPDDLISMADYDITDKFTITHTGSIFGYRNPIAFLMAVLRLVNNGIPRADIEIRFIGYIDKAFYDFVAKNNMTDIVKLISYLPHSDIIKHQKESTALLLITDPRGAIQIPGKLFEYIFSGRPILALVPKGVCSDIVENTHTGYCVDFNDVDAIAKLILSFYTEFKNGGLNLSPDYSQIEKYNARYLTKKLCQYLPNS